VVKVLFDHFFSHVEIPIVVFEAPQPRTVMYKNRKARLLLAPLSDGPDWEDSNRESTIFDLLTLPEQDVLKLEALLSQNGDVTNFTSKLIFHSGKQRSVSLSFNHVEWDGAQYIVTCIYPLITESVQLPQTNAQALATVVGVAYRANTTEEAIDRILAFTGEYADVSRIYIFESVSETAASNTYEWCAPGIKSVIDQQQNLPKEARSYNRIVQHGVGIANDICTSTAENQMGQELRNIKALAAIPITSEGRTLGYVGFDDCIHCRRWEEHEIQLLRDITDVLSSLLVRRNMERNLRYGLEVMNKVADNADSLIYVNDVRSKELLFVNRNITKELGAKREALLGKTCCEAMQNSPYNTCQHCPLEQMVDQDGNVVGPSLHWEYHSKASGKWFLVRDFIINWLDGRVAHMETATDITKQKEHEVQLERYASTDTMTGVYNREWGRKLLQGILEKSRYTNTCLAFIDLDGLKRVNDKLGHKAGDQMILKTVELIKAHTRKSDVLCRWGGDEFVMILRGSEAKADIVMKKILAQMEEYNKTNQAPYQLRFSYGLARINFQVGRTAEDLIAVADQRMYRDKLATRSPSKEVAGDGRTPESSEGKDEATIKTIADVIDIEYLQNIQDSLGGIVGITTVVLDPGGISLTQTTNLQAFCAMMQASETGRQTCIHANGTLMEINQETHQPAMITCPNSGCKAAAVPIFLGEQYLGSWLVWQVHISDIEDSSIEETALRAGISREVAIANIKLLPKIDEDKFQQILNFLATVIKTLTDMITVNAEAQEQNRKLTALTKRLDKSVTMFQDLVNHMGTYLVDYYTGELIMYNNIYQKLYSGTERELTGTCCYAYMGQQDFCLFCPREKLLDEEGVPIETPYVWEHYKRDVGKWLSISSRALYWFDGRLTIMTTFLDITARKEEEERIAYLAFHDQRLDIPNAVKLKQDLDRCADPEAYLICFDVQGLRRINDVYGRAAGDVLLRTVVTWIGAYIGTSPYRIDGDDFAIFIPEKQEGDLIRLAEVIYHRFDDVWILDMDGVEHRMFAGVHMGIIKAGNLNQSQETLLNGIDRVLSFTRKEDGVVLFDEERDIQVKEHLQFEVDLKSCVLNHMQGFSLDYQPLVAATTGQWIGMEALCRWDRPGYGSVPPSVFIPEAEQLGVIDILSDWVCEEAIRQVKEWGLDRVAGFTLDVNLSPIQLRDQELCKKMAHLLATYDFPPERLSLEITENKEIHFDPKTLAMLEQIRAMGISLSLDDFGVGYATFSNLRSLPVSTLKTDRSFVIGIEEDSFLQHTVRIMVEFAHAAGLVVVAEGVETELQRKIMERSGVDIIQGFYFSKPLTKEEVTESLHRYFL